MINVQQFTTKYKEEIKIDYENIKIHREDKNSNWYNIFWKSDKLKTLRLWPEIKIIRESPNLNDYFKLEMRWSSLPHNQVTVNINDNSQFIFDDRFSNCDFISIDSAKLKINMSNLLKVNVGIFAKFASGVVVLNRSREINLAHPSVTDNHSLEICESLSFKSLNQITILNNDKDNLNNYPKYNTVNLKFNILKLQGLWTKIADISIKNDGDEKELYSNQISNMSLSNLIFGDKSKQLSIRLTNDENKQLLIDEVTTYNYRKQNTYKDPSMSGKKGYIIPYNLKGNFFPILNISINGFFKNFKITIPYHFDSPFLDPDNGKVVMKTTNDNDLFDNSKKHSIIVHEKDFNTISKGDLTIDGIRNLEN